MDTEIEIEANYASVNILAVDDDPVALRVLKKGLQRCGYINVTATASAREALELTKSNVYNITLCDVVMPDMDGLTLLREIRSLSHTHEMTIIMVSATEDLSTVYKCLNQGADDFMVKPIRLPQLKNLWSNIWKKKRERRLLEQLNYEKTLTSNLGQELQNLQSQVSALNSKIDQAVDTPITAITRTISELQSQANLTSEVKNALGTILHSLASSNLYKPAFTKVLNNESVDSVTKKWLMTELGGTAINVAQAEAVGSVHWSTNDEESMNELRSFDYDVWTKREEDLVVYLNLIFNDFGLLDIFKVDHETFKRFLLEIRAHYVATNPYHNFIHSFDVTQSVYSYLTSGGAATYLTHLEIFSLLIAAVCHDVGHFGLNNTFLMATRHELAIRYNDQSILENFHTAMAFTILNKAEFNIFANLDKAQFNTARKLIINCILATDLAKHVELINKLQAVVENFSRENADHRLLLMQLLVKAADISNPAKPFPVARYWADMVQEEFFLQGDREKECGLDVSGFMDRDKPQLALMQTGFADYFVVPLFSLLGKYLPSTHHCLETLLQNRKLWENIKAEQGLK